VHTNGFARFEARMVQYEGPDLKHLSQSCQHVIEEIIALYHDESCFHANDFSQQAWCVASILPKFRANNIAG